MAITETTRCDRCGHSQTLATRPNGPLPAWDGETGIKLPFKYDRPHRGLEFLEYDFCDQCLQGLVGAVLDYVHETIEP